jgi:hypothetical protein
MKLFYMFIFQDKYKRWWWCYQKKRLQHALWQNSPVNTIGFFTQLAVIPWWCWKIIESRVHFNAKYSSSMWSAFETPIKKTSQTWQETESNHALNVLQRSDNYTIFTLTSKIPWDQELVDCCLDNLCEEK